MDHPPNPKILTNPSINSKKVTTDDRISVFQYFFVHGPYDIDDQKKMLSKWNDNQPHRFFKDIQTEFVYPDIVRLQLLIIQSYQQALVDLVISFENWLAFFLG